MKRITFFMIGLMSLASCSDLGGGTIIDLGFGPGDSTEIGNALDDDNVTFTTAKIVINDLNFKKTDSTCGLPSFVSENETSAPTFEKISFDKGPYVVDLVAQKVTPTLSELRLDAGKYCEFAFGARTLSQADVPEGIDAQDEIVGLSALFKGKFDPSSIFIVKVDEGVNFLKQSPTVEGFEFTPNQVDQLSFLFDLDDLFTNVDLNALVQTSGVYLIDSSTNTDAYDQIKINLRQKTRLIKNGSEDTFAIP